MTIGPGLMGPDQLIAIQDSSAGIFVRLTTVPAGLQVGRSIEVAGVLASPYGQLEVRQLSELEIGSLGPDPAPTAFGMGDIGEEGEGTLATVHGTVDSVLVDSGRLSMSIGDGGSVLRVFADPHTGLTIGAVKRGSRVVATGIVGQRATAQGRQDGYRLWLRGRADLVVDSGSIAGPSQNPTPLPTASGSAIHHDLASALGSRGSIVDVTATMTASVGLIDWGGPTIVVDDGTAACAVVVPVGTGTLRVGSRVHVVGKSGSYQGGSRVVATVVAALGEIQAIDVRQLGGALTAGQEWQLVQASGRIDRVTRVGVRWRADLLVAGRSVAVLGEPAAGIPAASVLPGRMAVVVGIVRRSTSDSGEFELLPRSSIDFRLGPALAASPTQRGGATPHSSAGMVLTARQNIASLPGSLGQTVVVSGLVVDSESGAATVDDGTGRVRIGGSAAAEAISLLEPGDAIEVGGLVQQDSAGWFIAADPASIVALAAIGDSESSAATISPQPADRARTMEPAPRASSSPALAVTLGMAFALAAGLVAAYSVHRSGRRIHRPALLGGRRLGRGGPASGSGGTI